MKRLTDIIYRTITTKSQEAELREILLDYGKQEHENGKLEGYELYKEEIRTAVYQEGYEQGKTDGENLGVTQVLDEIENDLEIPLDLRRGIAQRHRG